MLYVIFSGTIVRMGGAQMYISNKAKYMKSLGWNVKIISGLRGQILIHSLEEYSGGIIPELEYIPNVYPQRKREKILSQIISAIGASDGEEIVIESGTAHMSAWAELAAERLNARHFAFLLDEKVSFDKGFTEFFKFKYERNELSVIDEKYFEPILGSDYSRDLSKETVLLASCNNVVEDISDERFDAINYSDYDYVICSLGRLDKNYIPNVIEGFRDFAAAHPEKKIAYVFIGSQPDGYTPDMYAKIDKELSAFSYVTVYKMGYVYPIPSSFFEYVSAGAASSGSARVLWNKRIPTVSMDSSDGNPIGILGYTTLNILLREKEEPVALSRLLEMILTDGGLTEMNFTPCEVMPYEEIFKKHMSFIDNMSGERSYYDIRSVKLLGRKNKIKKAIISAFGFKGYRAIKNISGH